MPATKDQTSPSSQLERFKEDARALKAGEDEARCDERLKKVAKPKPERPE